ncbi:MAG: alanine--tRNA ligase [Verrucomicrobiota bacterium]|jgi:alanyl-tRNA synthetase
MMTSTQIRPSSQVRKDFLDFFKSKQHTIVPSSSLLPDSPNLLFTNAGMNQFVPIFLGQTKCPYKPGRAADTQKCIRAGGKHNDLEDVGLDTYHHTFFEMLGNWSFGDYFKKEAIEWAWELVTSKKWFGFPPERLYATVYKPGKGEPSEFDQEAYDHWGKLFKAAGLDPKVHICTGGKKDNFWMMGDTGPCGPCSEIHVDLTPKGDIKGSLVNKGDARCIEIWNLVFIQFNANPDGTFTPLPAKHVDTGMGFERVTGIIQCTKGFKDFANAKISNYETDIFRPIFDALEKLSGKKYGSTLPGSAGVPPASSQPSTLNPQLATDVAFRVIADHIRTLGFAIADGIQPGNTDRNYVLRRILRRAVRYGRTLGFHEPFFYKLVDVLADTMGDVFPEIRNRKKFVSDVIRGEEEAFNKTLDTGLSFLEEIVKWKTRILQVPRSAAFNELKENLKQLRNQHFEIVDESNVKWLEQSYDSALSPFRAFLEHDLREMGLISDSNVILKIKQAFGEFGAFWYAGKTSGVKKDEFVRKLEKALQCVEETLPQLEILQGEIVFKLYDTYGFPLDLTELMARERGLTVDTAGFEKLMEEQRERGRKAQKKEIIEFSQIETATPTKFVGYEKLETPAKVLEVVGLKRKTTVLLDTAVILDISACYAEMGGQVGDTGKIVPVSDVPFPSSERTEASSRRLQITNTQKSGNTWLHFVKGDNLPDAGEEVLVHVDKPRREAIQRHHTVTHLLHWALHEVVSHDASQKGSFVGPDKLTFDFNSAPLTPAQVANVEKLVNERILENAGVSWAEVPYADVKSRKDVMQFFGEKYGDTVRVVQIGGHAAKLDGYSMELCGGTHTRATGEIGLFRIVSENAIAAGVRRIEAVAGLEAYRQAADEVTLIKLLAGKVNSPVHELEKKIESLLEHQKAMEKQIKIAQQREASNAASLLLEEIKTINGVPAIIHNLGSANGDFLQSIADSLKGRFRGVIVLGGVANGAVALVAAVSPDFTAKVQAGKIIQQIAPIVGGKGGGKPDNARGGGKDAGKLEEALAKARQLI